MNGWIKIHREIADHWLWLGESFTKGQAWIDILLNVNYDKNKKIINGILLECERGQSIKSLDTWAKRWNWTKSKTRRFLKLLENDKMIELKSEQVTTRLTVCNYDQYQIMRNTDETETKHRRNQIKK